MENNVRKTLFYSLLVVFIALIYLIPFSPAQENNNNEVQVYIKMVASGTGEEFGQNYELWNDEKKAYIIHQNDGGQVVPGTYDLLLPERLFWYTAKEIEITDRNDQIIVITVPTGYVTFVYHNAEGSRDKDDRVFVTTISVNNENGTVPRYSKNIFKNSGEKIPLLPGKYVVSGWQHKANKDKGKYEDVEFEVKEGDDKEVILKFTPNGN